MFLIRVEVINVGMSVDMMSLHAGIGWDFNEEISKK